MDQHFSVRIRLQGFCMDLVRSCMHFYRCVWISHECAWILNAFVGFGKDLAAIRSRSACAGLIPGRIN